MFLSRFDKAFGQKDGRWPILLPKDEFDLRHSLMKEENDEYLEACYKKSLVDIADALLWILSTKTQFFIDIGTSIGTSNGQIYEMKPEVRERLLEIANEFLYLKEAKGNYNWFIVPKQIRRNPEIKNCSGLPKKIKKKPSTTNVDWMFEDENV